jgi:predicted RNA methylase
MTLDVSMAPATPAELKQHHADLDKYYTKVSVAQSCLDSMLALLTSNHLQPLDYVFVEPSAGGGAFLAAAQARGQSAVGFDISPTAPGIIQNDFLNDDCFSKKPAELQNKPNVTFGNPPFGRKASLALEFMNRSLSKSTLVGFVLPLQFRKWSIQSKILPQARLLLDETLDENSFEFIGKDYKLRCCFQVWTIDASLSPGVDLRISERPQTSHPDFLMYQYNRTPEALKFFDYDWDFAVPRQGFLDYSEKKYKKSDCDPKQQWIFFKASSPDVLKNLLALDFVALSKKNISTPGFGKGDVVDAYTSIYT